MSNRPAKFIVPESVLKATRKRLRRAQKQHGELLEKSQKDLVAQNELYVIERRLERAGVERSLARQAAEAGAGTRSLGKETMSRATIPARSALERILNGNDLVDVRFLLHGAAYSAAVGRINFGGRGFATGFLVAPNVIMTNHHVFGRAADTRGAQIEFGFHELNEGGSLSKPTTFKFDPKRLFFADESHDMAIVALGARASGTINLEDLPICRLTEEADAVIAGERLNVIQHPAGEPKQVALRDNTAIAVPDETFLQYRSDTKRGSSGSPVFNDEWQLVGLHHSGVPKTDDDGNWLDVNDHPVTNATPDHQIAWIANEAIQSSALFRLLSDADFTGAERDLVREILHPADRDEAASTLFGGSKPAPQAAPLANVTSIHAMHSAPATGSSPNVAPTINADGVVRVTVPIEISVRLGDTASAATTSMLDDGSSDAQFIARLRERFSIDEDYSNRNGYRADFLDETLPLPSLSDAQLAVAATNRQAIDGDPAHVLRYHNFSVVMNGERRVPFFTAVNIHGKKLIRISRDDDGGEADWIEDERIGSHEQTNNSHYKGRDNRLDRGHLVRRLDPGWGDSLADSARGIVDTFHYANCTPQYDSFNRSADRRRSHGLWLGLENFALDNAEEHDMKVSVFTGPVFRDSDPDFRNNGIKIPTKYWKIIAWVDEDGDLLSAAFLLSQKKMLDDDARIERMPEEDFDFRERDVFQTTVREIEELTELDFGPLSNGDGGRESLAAFARPRPLSSLADIRLA